MPSNQGDRVAVADLARMKRQGTPIVMVTAYDFASAAAAEAAGADVVLVGDSAATTVLGLSTTRDITLDEMLMLTRAVHRGIVRCLLVGDVPFGTYEQSDEQAVETARRFVDAGCEAVKMEGAGAILDRVRAVIRAGIPVMGHVGLQPQQLVAGEPGRVVGRSADAAMSVLADAMALEDAGCFSLIFEAVPAQVCEKLVRFLDIPIVGIGAGVATDGQVLVTYDLLGLTEGHTPKFVKRYAELRREMIQAMTQYADDVRERRFPTTSHTYGADAAELEILEKRLSSLAVRAKTTS